MRPLLSNAIREQTARPRTSHRLCAQPDGVTALADRFSRGQGIRAQRRALARPCGDDPTVTRHRPAGFAEVRPGVRIVTMHQLADTGRS
ncbi:hypothetical protein, partial [Nocardia cyriacigeorgica]|uniref:hypothetical protein n=1 Tax=Nocardia cyriacigeorgica TaxID=135487 RepID=UPI0024566437